MTANWKIHADRLDMTQQVAEQIIHTIQTALAQRGKAYLALSGGKTPIAVYEILAKTELDWANVVVIPTDERQVPENHAASNMRMLRESLLQGKAASAQLVALTDHAAVAALPDFDLVMLGMGEDGHTASLFPGAATLASAMNPQGTAAVAAITPNPLPPEAPFDRLTLTLTRLAHSRHTLLLISGDKKKQVAEALLSPGDALQPPLRGVLQATHCPIDIHWSA